MNENSLNIPQIRPDKPVYMQDFVVNGPDNPKPIDPQKVIKRKKLIKYGLLVLLVFIFINFLFTVDFYFKAKTLISSLKEVKISFSQKDFGKVKSGVAKAKVSMKKASSSYKRLSWLRVIPFLGGYVKDGLHVVNAGNEGLALAGTSITIIEPYSDLLGFSGGTEASGAEKAEDRINFLVSTISDIIPQLDKIVEGVGKIDKELAQINPRKYPVKVFGKPVRNKLEAGLTSFAEISAFLKNGKPLVKEMPYLLGIDSPRTFLLIFQNDKELRPTGGFITGYSILKVDKGKVEPVVSSDIYNLDAGYRPSIPAPEPIIKYLKGPYVLSKYLRLRDMNWSPDFGQTMEMFLAEAQKVDLGSVDGVISVDTQLLVNLLDVIGEIGVPGYGNFSNKIEPKCNCPQVIYELEEFADIEGPVVWDPAGTGKIIYAPANYDNRKKIIGPLMNSVLANVLAQPKDRMANLIEAVYRSFSEKHVLLYMNEDRVQKAVKSFGAGGEILDYANDYLLINDANLGGRKSNLYVTQEVTQDIKVGKDGSIEKEVVITYKNPEKHDGWLNSVLPNWVRVYVPKGSTLLSFDGISDAPSPYEENGKTVFAGYFELRPQGVVKLTLKYKIPLKMKKDYKLLLQKQPGKGNFPYFVKLGKKSQDFVLKSDKELIFPL